MLMKDLPRNYHEYLTPQEMRILGLDTTPPNEDVDPYQIPSIASARNARARRTFVAAARIIRRTHKVAATSLFNPVIGVDVEALAFGFEDLNDRGRTRKDMGVWGIYNRETGLAVPIPGISAQEATDRLHRALWQFEDASPERVRYYLRRRP